MKKITSILVLIVVLVLSIGFMGLSGLISNSLENSNVQLPDGWTKEDFVDIYGQLPNTLLYTYVPELNVSIINMPDPQEFDDAYTYSIEQGAENSVLNGTIDRKLEVKNITIEGINVKYVKNTFFSIKDNKIILISENYFYQKDGKYYLVSFSSNSSNKSATSSENPYRAQIDEAIKSIIKTI